jgi:hypothetical protein
MWDIYQASLTGENSLHVTFPVIIGFDDLGTTASNCVFDLVAYNNVPNVAMYEGVDILLKPRLINTYLVQSIITGYKLQSGYVEYIYKLYQNEPFVVPAEIIYSDNFVRTLTEMKLMQLNNLSLLT